MNGLKTAFTIRAPNARGLVSVERDESALVWRAMDERLPVEHRADINPVALLGVRLVTAPRMNPSPGSSPQHAYDIAHGGRRRRIAWAGGCCLQSPVSRGARGWFSVIPPRAHLYQEPRREDMRFHVN
jgi:hypothetical protein